MGYAKERGKLEQLSALVSTLTTFNEKNLAILNDCHEKYSHTVRILKNKAPDTFATLYSNELQAVKANKTALRESETDEARQQVFMQYNAALIDALAKTIAATLQSA